LIRQVRRYLWRLNSWCLPSCQLTTAITISIAIIEKTKAITIGCRLSKANLLVRRIVSY